MKSPPFDYYDPHTLDEALSLLRDHGEEAKLLAGGQSLVPLMNFRLAQPAVIVDLNRIEGLSYISEEDGMFCIGAMTRQAALETDQRLRGDYPLLSEGVRFMGHPSIRNRGTVGGSLAHADPAAEFGAVALCADAQMKLSSREGTRWVAVRDFFQGPYTTCLEPTEILTEVRLRKFPKEAATAFLELARREGDFALAGVAALVEMSEDGFCRDARIALFGAGSVPCRAEAAERALRGERLTEKTMKEATSLVTAGVDLLSDIHASSEYREHLARVLTYRALRAMSMRIRIKEGG